MRVIGSGATQNPVQAMVLAAGLGTRLWPLTSDRAKPAVPFLGKPLVVWVLELLARHGIDRAVVNTHYQPRSVEDAAAGARGIEVKLSHEREILGTAGALAKARDEGLLDLQRPTLLINGKLYAELDLSLLLDAHNRSGAKVTMALRSNPRRERFREVLVEDGRVIGFGKTDRPEGASPLLFTGVHVIEPSVLAAIPSGNSDTVRDVYPALIASGSVGASIDDRGRWWEFSTLERYLELHLQAAKEGLGPDVVAHPSAQIAAGAKVTRSVLWEGASVPSDATLDRVVLGADVSLPEGTVLTNAVVVRRDRAADEERGEKRGDLLVVGLTAA